MTDRAWPTVLGRALGIALHYLIVFWFGRTFFPEAPAYIVAAVAWLSAVIPPRCGGRP
jgi:hypothetical protein